MRTPPERQGWGRRRKDMKKNRYYVIFLGVISLIFLIAGCTSYNSSTPTATAPAQGQQQYTLPPTVTSASAPTPSAIPPRNPLANTVAIPSFADLLAATENSVVEINITATATVGRGRTVQEQGAGSGWIWDTNGTIVTNNHVVQGATNITVTTIDGQMFPAQVINTDPTTDLALVRIMTAAQLPSLKTGDASKVRAGDWVLAIGNPLGQGIIATQGIISRMGVNVALSATQTYNDLIETTTAINPGNSGGPLINMSGEVIGITSLGAAGAGVQGMGYAISMADALPVIQKLAAK
jgi:serine protease Do